MPIAPIIYGHHGGLPQIAHMRSEICKLQEEPALNKSYEEVLRETPEALCQIQTEIDFKQ